MPHALMLATSSGPDRDPQAVIERLMRSGGWTFEVKFDGIRALAEVRSGEVTITNRNGTSIGHRYPDVVEALTGLPDLVLDGEIVCPDGDGRPDFARVHRRDAQSHPLRIRQLARACPAQFVAFDVLEHGVDLRRRAYRQRREVLEQVGSVLREHGAVVPPVDGDGRMMWAMVADLALEGLVAKQDTSTYVGRRAKTWLKIKRTSRVSVLVTGSEPGRGSRASTFRALEMGLFDRDGTIVDVGSVGSGFAEADLQRIWRMLQADEQIVIEVEYLDISPHGILREPVFKGLRNDVPASSCSLGQVISKRPIG